MEVGLAIVLPRSSREEGFRGEEKEIGAGGRNFFTTLLGEAVDICAGTTLKANGDALLGCELGIVVPWTLGGGTFGGDGSLFGGDERAKAVDIGASISSPACGRIALGFLVARGEICGVGSGLSILGIDGVVVCRGTTRALVDGGIVLALGDCGFAFDFAAGLDDFFRSAAFLKLSTILPVGFLGAGLVERVGAGAGGAWLRRAAALILARLKGFGLYTTVSSL